MGPGHPSQIVTLNNKSHYPLSPTQSFDSGSLACRDSSGFHFPVMEAVSSAVMVLPGLFGEQGGTAL